jgi:hypothetical protein
VRTWPWLDSIRVTSIRQDVFEENSVAAGAAGNPDAVVLKKMLEAEYAVLTGTPTQVRNAFECAIEACQASGFVHYEAHLSERLGIILVELGHFEMASRYLSKAVLGFEAWSAAAKVRSTKKLLKAVTRQIGYQPGVSSSSNRHQGP